MFWSHFIPNVLQLSQSLEEDHRIVHSYEEYGDSSIVGVSITKLIRDNDEIIIDGEKGIIILHPDKGAKILSKDST